MRCYIVLVSVAVLLVGASVAVGETPVVENLYVPLPEYFVAEPGSYVDITPSLREVTIPAGTAILTWSVCGTGNSGGAWYRPFIGDAFPTDGIHSWKTDVTIPYAGSWQTYTSGGTVTVGLQVMPINGTWHLGQPNHNEDNITWSLTVYPEAAPIPAISGVGLAVMAVFLVAVGGFVFSRMKRQAA